MKKSSKTLFFNANITTLDENMPYANAVCVSNERIEAVGTLEEMRTYLANAEFEEIDCNNKFLYPGFIDTHSHLTLYSKMIDSVFCGAPSKNIAEVLAKIKAKADLTPKGDWILGYSYDDSALSDNRHLDRHDLDSVSTEHPIFIYHISSHMGYLNSMAIELMGINKDSAIEGGEYVKDEQGVPTGFLLEFAFFESQKFVPKIPSEELYTNFQRGIADYNKCGITTFFDGGLGFGGGKADECLNTLVALNKDNKLNARAYLQFFKEDVDFYIDNGLIDYGTDYIKFGGVKYFTDGSIQIFTAALAEDYETKPGHKGELLFPIEEIDAVIEKYHCKNVQIAIHTNGTYASEVVIQAFEKALKKNPRTDLFHMLIHAQTVTDEQLERMKACGVYPTFFSKHVEVWGDRHAKLFLGKARTERMNPAGSALRLGMPFSLHVDTPVLPVTVLENMHVAVNRVSSGGVLFGADQRIPALEALKAYTSYANLFLGTQGQRGTIEVNKFADFVLLDEDLLTCDVSKIRDIKVLKTICGGRTVYEA